MIEAATVSVKTMADDTLRLTVDIEPTHAQEAFSLFGSRGSPVVIARLTPDAAKAATQAETVSSNTLASPAPEKPKGRDLARLAGMWCDSRKFRDWACEEFGFHDLSPQECAELIRSECEVDSRAELDHNPEAAEKFHRYFRVPFAEWQR